MSQISMDFSLGDDQAVAAQLAASVFAGHSTDERVVQTERDALTYDAELWSQLVSTGLLEAPLGRPGSELGMVGLTSIAQEQGKHLGRVPLVPTAVVGMALCAFSNDHGDVLEGIRRGNVRVAIATPELCGGVTASVDGDGWTLAGELSQVYLVGACTHLVVTAFDEGGHELTFLLDLDCPDILCDEFEGLSRNVHGSIGFNALHVGQQDLFAISQTGPIAPGRWVHERFLVGLAAVQVGLCTEALRRAAEYTSNREQFGRPLSTNQGVAMRAADAHIDIEAMWVTMLDAAWRLDNELDSAEAVAIATWWAREGGVRVVHATQHLHGGTGADMDNHIHRFFLWAREFDIIAGPAPVHLNTIGDLMAAGATP